jgi:hypothetical protein
MNHSILSGAEDRHKEQRERGVLEEEGEGGDVYEPI